MSVIQGNDQTFKEAVSQNQFVVVKYHADWCGSCKLIAPKFAQLSENENYKSKNVQFLEIDAEHNPEARKAANVSNLPYFAIFKNGDLITGDFTSKIESVQKMIDKVI